MKVDIYIGTQDGYRESGGETVGIGLTRIDEIAKIIEQYTPLSYVEAAEKVTAMIEHGECLETNPYSGTDILWLEEAM